MSNLTERALAAQNTPPQGVPITPKMIEDTLQKKANPLIVIPPITHELGRGWFKQPDPKNILIDNKHAIMSQMDLDLLAEYSCSRPTGVYEGKMWKAHWKKTEDGPYFWFLCWYGVSDNPNKCSINTREVLIVD